MFLIRGIFKEFRGSLCFEVENSPIRVNKNIGRKHKYQNHFIISFQSFHIFRFHLHLLCTMNGSICTVYLYGLVFYVLGLFRHVYCTALNMTIPPWRTHLVVYLYGCIKVQSIKMAHDCGQKNGNSSG